MGKTATTPKRDITTVAIDSTTQARLDAFCAQYGFTKKEFINLAVTYFERTGIDPRTEQTAEDIQAMKKTLQTEAKEREQRMMEHFKEQEQRLTERLNAIQETTNQAKQTTDQTHGIIMGNVANSIMTMLQTMASDREESQRLLIEAQEERQQAEELKAEAEAEKKRHWWQRKK